MRGKAVVLGWVPVTGQRGVYNCAAAIGTDSCHPPGASSVRSLVSISHLKPSVIKKMSKFLLLASEGFFGRASLWRDGSLSDSKESVLPSFPRMPHALRRAPNSMGSAPP
jgi:hypothetical protein